MVTHLAALLAACAAAPVPGTTAAQVVTVEAPRAVTTHATVRLWERAGSCWRVAAGPWPARLGRSGLSARRREGDGTTPVGVFALGPAYGTAADPGARLPYRRLACGDWWDADPTSPTYNRFRHVPCGARPPFAGASEPLWRYPVAYRHFLATGFNSDPVVPGRGSAIFLHADTGRATSGCVSVGLDGLVTLLRRLRPSPQPLVAIRVDR
jgi:L,D-peptidoglycan transpeptidase YkuD (ErfK/YbiS/YcfS/YnhG family)